METKSLNATVRTDFGKGAARKIRGTGHLPAVVYRGGAEALSVTIPSDELEAIFRRSMNRNTLIKLETAQGNRTCLVKDVQRHPVSQAIRHVDFYEVDANQEVEVIVKVVPVGTALGTQVGGKLQLIRRDLKITCKPDDIPAQVEVDVSEMNVDDIYRVSQVTPPKGCKIVFLHDFNLATVLGKRVEEELEEEEVESEEDGDETVETEEG